MDRSSDYFLGRRNSVTAEIPASVLYDARFEQRLEKYGAVFNGTSDDSSAIQDAINDLSFGGVCNGPKRIITFPPGATAKINSTIEIDVARVRVNGNGALLLANGMTSGYAMRITGSQASPGPYGQQCGGVDNFHIMGHLSHETTALAGVGGILFDSDVVGAGTRASYRSLYVRGFGVGIVLFDRTYLNTFFDPEVAYCTTGWNMVGGEDAGESVSIFGGVTFNGGLAFKSDNYLGHFNLHCHSVDYNWRFAELTAGATMFCNDSNFETNQQFNEQIIVDGGGACFSMRGGKLHNVAATPGTFDSLIYCGNLDHNCYVILDGVWMKSWKGTLNRLAKGNGRVIISNPIFYDGALATMPPVIGAGQFSNTHINDKMMDPAFESGTTATPTTSVVDNVFIYADGAAITDRFNGTNGEIGISTSFARSGTKSLELKKNTAAGNTFKVAVAVPATRRAAWGGECYVRGDGSVTGTYGISANYTVMKPTTIGTLESTSTAAFVNLTSLTPGTSFTQRELALSQLWYAAQTHYLVIFDLTDLGIGSLYVDDLHISEW